MWAKDIAEGMAHIHNLGYAHRDLKSANVLYCKKNMRAKVTDFGMSTRIQPSAKVADPGSRYWRAMKLRESREASPASADALHTASCGTPSYMAPELCAREIENHERYEGLRHDDRGFQEALSSWKVETCKKIAYTQKVHTYHLVSSYSDA